VIHGTIAQSPRAGMTMKRVYCKNALAAALVVASLSAAKAEEMTMQQQLAETLAQGMIAQGLHCVAGNIAVKIAHFINILNTGFTLKNDEDLRLTRVYEAQNEAAVSRVGAHAWCIQFVSVYHDIIDMPLD
jgi:tetrahydromethanopterin S-methyltransferase subunit C